jgi:hypothetical protein
MSPCKYYRYVNLPRLPDNILEHINFNFDQYSTGKASVNARTDKYSWTDSFNKEINEWCQKNICDEIYFAFQIIRGDLPAHKDLGTKTKFCYLLSLGGDNVITSFYDDQKNILESVKFELHRWHILKVDSYHGVQGMEPGKTRFSITGQIF